MLTNNMRLDVNVNRSGMFRKSTPTPPPSYVAGPRIAPNHNAIVLDYEVRLVTPTSSGCRLLSFDEYLDTNRNPSSVYALLCRLDPEYPSDCRVVDFVASVFGMSDEFQLQASPEIGARTVCMSVQLRPGHPGDYRYVVDLNFLWNVKTAHDDLKGPIIFRPSYEVMRMYPDGELRLQSSTRFMGGSIMYILSDPASPGDIVARILLNTANVIDGLSLDLGQSKLLPDGLTVSPGKVTSEGNMVDNFRIQLWDVIGYHAEDGDLYWAGLKYDPTSRDLSVVALRSGAISEAGPVIPAVDRIRIVYGDVAEPVS